MKYKAIVIGLMLMASAAHSSEWRHDVSASYTLHSSESIEDGKLIIINKMKMNAAENVGSYVIKTELLRDDDISQFIELLSASRIRLDDIHYKTIAEGESVRLVANATASVDTDEIKSRVSYVKENRQLRDELSRLSESYLKAINQKDTPASPLIREFDSGLSRVFSKSEVNTLLAHSEASIAAAHDDIETFFKQMEGSDFSVNVIGMREIERSRSVRSIAYRFAVQLRPNEDALGTLSKHFTRQHDGDSSGFALGRRSVQSERDAYDLFRHLTSKMTVIAVTVGGTERYIPIAYAMNNYNEASPRCNQPIGVHSKGANGFCVDTILEGEKLSSQEFVFTVGNSDDDIEVKASVKTITSRDVW